MQAGKEIDFFQYLCSSCGQFFYVPQNQLNGDDVSYQCPCGCDGQIVPNGLTKVTVLSFLTK